ncbi:MBL fold metallo-hydrolase [Jatrophihabitans sp.]|uniref:MBL fold metallo-hydrolase n=1 Tax=Jatrophihabitans sp. TaxID=1932789 RepID=UPI0030C703FE|nr:Zn-dependent hydrolase, including glyoxylase [Jatrophihabitans sp.]
MTAPVYEQLVTVTPYASLVLQSNPGLMTLDGTNTWLLRAPGTDRTVLVDPGQEDQTHLETVLAAAGSVEAVLLTHGHYDHCQVAARVHELTGAPVRGVDPKLCIGGAAFADGEVVEAAGLRIQIWATPGHSADSASFVIADSDGTAGAVLTGDTILGRGTTVVAFPDGDLGSYLASLRRLRELGDLTVLPGHGPVLEHAGEVAQFYLDHREQRLDQVRAAVAALGPEASARAVVERVYVDVDEALWDAAEVSVEAQLAYLRAH